MSIGSVYWDEERARRADSFVCSEEQKRAIRNAGYFTRRELNEMGARPFRDTAEDWFVIDGVVYGRTACVFQDGVDRFRKLLSGQLLLELA